MESMPDVAPRGERFYSIAEIARTWGTAVSQVSKMFKDEPGVLPVQRRKPFGGIPDRLHQRRIPASVVERVESRRSAPLSAGIVPISPPQTYSSPAPIAPELAGGQDPAKRTYSFNQIAAMWNITPIEAAFLFRNEPDVLGFLQESSAGAKSHSADPKYNTPRVPLSLLQRVFAQLPRTVGKAEKVENVENQRKD